ncbi:MAG: Rieske (2Fe-2S) protein [Desulfosarcina sp.]|jgi:cytochrome b6-f complex iron-sulfur subunit
MSGKKQKQPDAEPKPPRRGFLVFLWTGLGLAALLELIWVATTFLRPAASQAHKDDIAEPMAVGPVDAFTTGTVTAFPRGRFYLARLDDGGFLALSRRCPHLGCTLPWIEEEQRFVCPCHSSVFDIRGEVVSSPAPRAMDQHRVIIENEIVRVDAGTIIKRDRFEVNQLVYPTITKSG